MHANQVRAAAERLIQADLLGWERVASLQSLGVSPNFNEVALDSTRAYEDVFVAGLSLRHFNFCLKDYSFVQLSAYGGGLRFAFFPNPFVFDSDLVELIDDPSDFGAFELDELSATAARSPIRFDMSPNAYVPCQHPYAHVHLGHGELGRLACRRILSPESFVLIVMKLFYPDAWNDFGCEIDAAGFGNSLDSRLATLLGAETVLTQAQFSAQEERLFALR
jgi:hypothetical protein